jgi:hypothetical protein
MPADPASAEAQLLVEALAPSRPVQVPPRDDLALWAASGAMALTGRPDGPPLVPAAPVAARLAGAAAVLAALGGPSVDGPGLLAMRAGPRGLSRRGRVSAGGASRLLPTRDGWLAVTLSRPDDLELVPAWLQGSEGGWDAVAAAARSGSAAGLAARGQELGLAVAVVADSGSDRAPWRITRAADPPGPAPERLRVLDLSALWAGPLCAHLLHGAGAEVVTVDSTGRPDGARVGDPQLFGRLHEGHRTLPLDLRTAPGRAELQRQVAAADVVVTSVRRRALERLGVPPEPRPGRTWVAITAYGLDSDDVGFGDDTAAAGGLVAWDGEGPVFCADAAADPVTGLYAALAALATARAGGGLVDVALRDVASHLARPPLRDDRPSVHDGPAGWVVETAQGPVPVAAP